MTPNEVILAIRDAIVSGDFEAAKRVLEHHANDYAGFISMYENRAQCRRSFGLQNYTQLYEKFAEIIAQKVSIKDPGEQENYLEAKY